MTLREALESLGWDTIVQDNAWPAMTVEAALDNINRFGEDGALDREVMIDHIGIWSVDEQGYRADGEPLFRVLDHASA